MPTSYPPLDKLAKQRGMSPFDVMMNLGMAGDLAPGLQAGGELAAKAKAPAGRAATIAGQEAARYSHMLETLGQKSMIHAGDVMKPMIQNLLRMGQDFGKLGHKAPQELIEDTLKTLAERGPQSANDPHLISYLQRLNHNLSQLLGRVSKSLQVEKASSPFTTQARAPISLATPPAAQADTEGMEDLANLFKPGKKSK